MGYKVRTKREGYLRWQKDALPYIEALGIELGIGLNRTSSWIEDKENYWYRPDQRDTIVFSDFKIVAIESEDKDFVVVESKPRWAAYREVVNDTDTELSQTVTYEMEEAIRKLDEDSSLTGWSVEVSLGFSVGKDDANKFTGEITAGAHGEYGKRSEKEKTATTKSSSEISVIIPARSKYEVQQREDRSKIEVPIHQKIIFDCGFDIRDYDHYDADSPLHKNKRRHRTHHRKGSGKGHSVRYRDRYSLLELRTSEDMYNVLSGLSGDFPNLNTDLLSSNRVVRESYDWLSNTDKRSIEVDIVEKYENSSSGHVRVVDSTSHAVIRQTEV